MSTVSSETTQPLSSTSSNPKDLLGIKKPQIWLVPPAAIIHTSKAFEDGAIKYGPYNWRSTKVGSATYVSAALRHVYSYMDGEDYATDSGCHHLGHGIACLSILLDAAESGCLIDDRAAPGTASRLINKMTSGS